MAFIFRTLTSYPNTQKDKYADKDGPKAQKWAEQLADCAEQLIDKVPEREEWDILRHFLQDIVRMLRGKDYKSGMVAMMRILPYIQKAVSSVEKCVNVTDTYQLTESITSHFLVDENARLTIENFMKSVKSRIMNLKKKIEQFSTKMDNILEAVLNGKEDITWYLTVKLAFQMNRINALIRTNEDDLIRVRQMIDELDTHVAGKSFMASLCSFVCVLFGIAFSASGNLPIGAACLATATATRKSAKNLEEYRKELSKIDKDHLTLQSKLNEWRHKFRAEQRNFLLLFGFSRALLSLTALIICLFLLGKTANFVFFAIVFLYLVVLAEETNNRRYYAAIALGIVAIVMEFQKQNGLLAFNTFSAFAIVLQLIGFFDI